MDLLHPTAKRLTATVGLVLLALVVDVSDVVAQQQQVNIAKVGGSDPIAAICDDPAKVLSVPISTASSGNTQLVGLTASQIIYACGYDFIAAGTVNVKFTYGTGASCGTGTTDITGAYNLTAQTGLARTNAGHVQFKGAVSNAACINLSTTVQVSGLFTYVKQ